MAIDGNRPDLRALEGERDIPFAPLNSLQCCTIDDAGAFSDWKDRDKLLIGWKANTQLAMASTKGHLPGKTMPSREDLSQLHAAFPLSSIINASGRLPQFVLAGHDSAHKSAQKQGLEANAALQRAILDTAPDSIFTIDQDGKILSLNKEAELVFGYDGEEILGLNFKILISEIEDIEPSPHIQSFRDDTITHLIGNSRRVMGKHKDGSLIPHSLVIGDASTKQDQLFILFLRDIRSQEETERQLREAKSEITQLVRVSALCAVAKTLTHELNQPLAAIANYVQASEAIIAQAENEALDIVKDALDRAGKETLRAGAIVQNLHDYVKRGELERTLEFPHAIVQQAIEMANSSVDDLNVNCIMHLGEESPSILVSRLEITQVIFNLICNSVDAMKDCGEVLIEGTVKGDKLHLTVSNNGPGIPAWLQGVMSEPFASSKSSRPGLGLAISKTIVEGHNGELWCKSTPGEGSAFHFTLPLAEKTNV